MAKKGKYRYLNTKFWSDNYIVNLKPLQRYFFIYLLTNEHTNICGVYELALQTIVNETGLKKSEVLSLFNQMKSRMHYLDGWVCLRNWIKYQELENDKIVKGILERVKDIPQQIWKKLIGYRYPIYNLYMNYGKALNNTNTNTNTNTNNSVGDKNANAVKNKFDFKKLTDELIKDSRRHIQIIGLYFKHKDKGIDPENEKQFESAWKRELKAASNLASYSNSRILEVINYLKENANYKWGLETIGKFIDENLDSINNINKDSEFELPAYAKNSGVKINTIQNEKK